MSKRGKKTRYIIEKEKFYKKVIVFLLAYIFVI